ncbi:MAG: Gfo/Idh/MocA family protein [Saprospiraceae bacterium]
MDFALIGAAGYIAPRHMKAIRDSGGRLVAAVDKNDSVGVMDAYFPDAAFFTEFERFDRHIEKLRREGHPVRYLSVCSPNYLHDAHIRAGLRYGADVICEKPLVLNPWNAEALQEIEAETGRRVYSILQLRLHPAIIDLRDKVNAAPDKIWDVELTYITSRGKWYYAGWKGDIQKSGGIATNIGIHFFDMLQWVFGPIVEQHVHLHTHDRAAGSLMLARARVRWFLSINSETLPPAIRESGKTTFRNLSLDGLSYEFSEGFTDLHTESYRRILSGEGFGIAEALPSIRAVWQIRNAKVDLEAPNPHPFVYLPLANHPFE